MLANTSSETGHKAAAGHPSQTQSTHPQSVRHVIERDNSSGLQPLPNGISHPTSARNLSTSVMSFGPRGSSLNPATGPGSFSSELRSQIMASRAGSRLDVGSVCTGGVMDKVLEETPDYVTEQQLLQLKDKLAREMKIKEGSENMLEALNVKKAKQTKEQRQRVEAELSASNLRIRELRHKISDAQQAQQQQRARPATPTRSWTQESFLSNDPRSKQSPAKSPTGESDMDQSVESPSFALAELLQALEFDGMTPEYYVSRANQLVGLFKRHPTIKYDLVWSIFGLRMQMMLLSESREVVAAGYRVTRYAISDLNSLKRIRSLNTDFLVVRSLNNYRKADVEREQALKFVRAFLDVKDGIKEISRAVVRTIVAVAEQGEDRRTTAPVLDQNIDRLRPICIETLAEILVRDPPLLLASGGLGPLSDALSEGSYKASESLTAAFLFLLDTPQKRKYLQPSYGLDALFTAFTDPLGTNEVFLKQSCRAISLAMRSWSGIMTLSMYDFRPVRSLIYSMLLPTDSVRETVLDLLFSILRIKPPAWATSFLAGRRLTTYGRVTNLRSGNTKEKTSMYMEEDGGEQNFVDHYTALLLAVLVKAGLLNSLLQIAQTEEDAMLKRKTSLLLSEVLKLSSRLLPSSWSAQLQLLPELFKAATDFGNEEHFIASGIIYQISSVSKTLYRSAPSEVMAGILPSSDSMVDLAALEGQPRAVNVAVLDDTTFRQLLIDSGVLNSSNYVKWDWDIIIKVIAGPLQNGKRLEEAVRASKFMKRIMSFYRPFKYKFAEIKNTRNTQKYVQAGCALMHSLMQSNEGVSILSDSKLVRQIAECLAQCDPTSGLTAQFPLFAKDRLTDTLCNGYFAMLGILTSDQKGLMLLERWKMFNMMHHIVDLKQRPDLIKLLLTNFDYTLQGHHRVLLAKALTAGTKDIRTYATDVLRKCTLGRPTATNALGDVSDSRWAIQLLSTQLYDPEIDVCATAVKILEEACNRKKYLEYVVECRPALDHLGEIGAPLLLRFLSTSIGYHYLDGLDYISNEMDDWFLGRNDGYVSVIEASLAKSFLMDSDEQGNQSSIFDATETEGEFHNSHVPPHFYRELTRTREGCKLLRDKGHFDEFAATIRDYGMQAEDRELITKVKGCMWAVGNVGCMELGAPFLEASDVVEQMVKIAESHSVMSLRGTAFFVLGLISRSTHGLEILSEQGWDASTSPLGHSLGYCMPSDIGKLLSLKPWNHVSPSSITLPTTQRTVREPPPAKAPSGAVRGTMDTASSPVTEEEVNARVGELLVDLGNSVLYKRALVELQKLKQRKPSAFRSTEFFKHVMGLMEWNHYRLGVRRMVIDLFDKNVMRQIVFEEDSGEQEEKSGEESDEEGTVSKRGLKEQQQRRRRRQQQQQQQQQQQKQGSSKMGAKVAKDGEDEEGNCSGNSQNSDDNRTERQRSVSEPAEYLRTSMLPPPLNLGR